MGFYDTKAKFDSSLINNMGGTGKAFAYLGQSLSDISDAETKKLKEKKDEEWKQKLYQDSRADRKEDVDFRNNNANREQSNFNTKMNFVKEESNREQKNHDAKFDFEKGRINKADAEQQKKDSANIEMADKYLMSIGVNPNSYSREAKLYNYQQIEDRHTDKSPFRYTKTFNTADGLVNVFSNKNGEVEMRPWVNPSTVNTSSSEYAIGQNKTIQRLLSKGNDVDIDNYEEYFKFK